MSLLLRAVEARVLGALIEKEITTPDYYPLSLNALLNACNQKSNREPVMDLDEDTVRQALHFLQDKKLAGPVSAADSRVPKYEHRLSEVFNLGRRETALLCVLLLRGPQTPGELRGRSERMYSFAELADVQTTLERMISGDPALVRILPRQPGTKEARYVHLLSDTPEGEDSFPVSSVSRSNMQCSEEPRIALLEEQVARLRQEIVELRQQCANLQSNVK